MFTLDTLTKVRVLDVRVLSKKDRGPDELPGGQLLLRTTLGAGALAMFDGFLPGVMYRKPSAKKQGELDGLESAELTSVGEHVKRMPWDYEQTGCALTIDFGMGGASNIDLADCKVHRVSFRPEQQGVVIQWTVDAPALDDSTRGKLTGLKSTDVQMLQAGPKVEDDAQAEIPGAGSRKGKAAEKPAGQASKDALDAGGNNPFGGGKSDDEVRNEALASGKPAGEKRGKAAAASVE